MNDRPNPAELAPVLLPILETTLRGGGELDLSEVGVWFTQVLALAAAELVRRGLCVEEPAGVFRLAEGQPTLSSEQVLDEMVSLYDSARSDSARMSASPTFVVGA